MSTPVKVTLVRNYEDSSGTHGELILDRKKLCFTLEEPWRQNKRSISCIPAGLYQCVPHTGNNFKDVWHVTGVMGRDAILIHAGNTLKDTEGCILVGLSRTSNGIGQSQAALKELRDVLPDRFTLEVKGISA